MPPLSCAFFLALLAPHPRWGCLPALQLPRSLPMRYISDTSVRPPHPTACPALPVTPQWRKENEMNAPSLSLPPLGDTHSTHKLLALSLH
jgi:hypothetical protein